MAQWLTLCTSNAECVVSIPGQELRTHMPWGKVKNKQTNKKQQEQKFLLIAFFYNYQIPFL